MQLWFSQMPRLIELEVTSEFWSASVGSKLSFSGFTILIGMLLCSSLECRACGNCRSTSFWASDVTCPLLLPNSVEFSLKA
ncbi:hypothetical protein LINPERHAP1_LOCUS15483 [Linum perenne]